MFPIIILSNNGWGLNEGAKAFSPVALDFCAFRFSPILVEKIMKILYGFVPYAIPKKGIFFQPTNEYNLPDGWGRKEIEETIIGETNDCYIYQLKETGHGEWIGDKVIQHKYILPVGIHKSRLKLWTIGQLSFNFH